MLPEARKFAINTYFCNMNLTLKEIALKFNGSIEGGSELEINKLSKIETAKLGSITFLANKKYTPFLYTTEASAVLIQKNFIVNAPVKSSLIRVNDPYAAFTSLLLDKAKEKENFKTGIHPSAIISPSASLGKDVYVGANTVIGESKIESGVQIHANCVIGDQVYISKNTIVYPCVSILDNSEIGTSCIINSGVIIGSDGFGFALQDSGDYIKIPQLGKVVLKNNVEIGANSTIDRATLGETIIYDGVKLDNMVQIAHNVEIGSHTVIAAQTGIAGSTKIGARCVIGGQVGIAGHLKVGNDVKIQGKSGVTKSIPDGRAVQGNPAMNFKSFYKSYALFKQLPIIEARLRKLEQK